MQRFYTRNYFYDLGKYPAVPLPLNPLSPMVPRTLWAGLDDSLHICRDADLAKLSDSQGLGFRV